MQKAPFVYVREACSYTFGTTTASKHTSPLSFSICIFYFSKRRAVFSLPLCPNQIIPVRPPGAALLTPGGLRVMTAPDDGSHHNFSTCFTSLSQKTAHGRHRSMCAKYAEVVVVQQLVLSLSAQQQLQMAKLLPLSCAQEEKKRGRRRRRSPPSRPSRRRSTATPSSSSSSESTDGPSPHSVTEQDSPCRGKGRKSKRRGGGSSSPRSTLRLSPPSSCLLGDFFGFLCGGGGGSSTSNTHTQAHRGKRDYPPFLFLLLQKAAVVAAAAAGDAARGGGGGGGGGETGHRKRRKGREGELEREGGTDGRTHRLSLQSPHP